MNDQFFHGVNVVEITSGPRTIRTSKSAVIGVIGTAPDGDSNVFPLNKPSLIAGSLKEALVRRVLCLQLSMQSLRRLEQR